MIVVIDNFNITSPDHICSPLKGRKIVDKLIPMTKNRVIKFRQT